MLNCELSNYLKRLGLSSSTLISVSRFDAARTVHRSNGRVYKIVDTSKDLVQGTRTNTLRQEAIILEKLNGKVEVPQRVRFSSAGHFEHLAYDYVDGNLIEACQLNVLQRLLVLFTLSLVLCRLSIAGVAHRDLNLTNVICNRGGRITLLDFDQAVETSIRKAFALNFLGRAAGTPKAHGTFLSLSKELHGCKPQITERSESMKRIKKLIMPFVPKILVEKYRRMLMSRQSAANKRKWEKYLEIPELPEGAGETLQLIREAWLEAKYAKSNTPGFDIAYYALAIDGFHFPGERPWAERWSYLKDAVDLRGRRILELGCNLSLLSCSALRDCGAEAAFCVDADYRILSAAQKVAAAFQVQPTYKRVNFDSDVSWEDDLIRFEPNVVFALNILNWVLNKERLLTFVSKFDLIIYEGHDTFEVEKARFSSLGYAHVEIIASSERERDVLKISR